MLAGWIIDEKLRAFLEIVSEAAGSPFDADDWTAVSFGFVRIEARSDPVRLDYRLAGATRCVDLAGART